MKLCIGIDSGEERLGIVNGEISFTLYRVMAVSRCQNFIWYNFLKINEWIFIRFHMHTDIKQSLVGIENGLGLGIGLVSFQQIDCSQFLENK